LGVEAFTGENMTKEAVVQGLGSARLSVLMTHGIVKPDTYPHGVLVLRAPGIESKPSTMATASLLRTGDGVISLVRSGAPDFWRGTNLDVVMKEAGEVLTAEEISALPTGIPAGLVVLSACETGKGEVTSEGLLGLGRAVLQAGAAAVVVSHWKVFDLSTKELMTGLFQPYAFCLKCCASRNSDPF
jgi:CHAT domain-containing protein